MKNEAESVNQPKTIDPEAWRLLAQVFHELSLVARQLCAHETADASQETGGLAEKELPVSGAPPHL
jgi:hypothetical protein